MFSHRLVLKIIYNSRSHLSHFNGKNKNKFLPKVHIPNKGSNSEEFFFEQEQELDRPFTLPSKGFKPKQSLVNNYKIKYCLLSL